MVPTEINNLKDQQSKELVAKVILKYYEKFNRLKFDSAREEFTILGTNSELEQCLARDVLMVLGADECRKNGDKAVVSQSFGAKKLAKNIKQAGLKFQGMDDLIINFAK
jgi:hypothetical protein